MQTERKRILVVDDESAVTAMLRRLFERAGCYRVREENCSTRVLATAAQFRPDLVLLDVDMPKLGGGELASLLEATPLLRDVPIIFLTGLVTKEEVFMRGGRIGGLAFLAKPIQTDELLACVRQHLGCTREGNVRN